MHILTGPMHPSPHQIPNSLSVKVHTHLFVDRWNHNPSSISKVSSVTLENSLSTDIKNNEDAQRSSVSLGGKLCI